MKQAVNFGHLKTILNFVSNLQAFDEVDKTSLHSAKYACFKLRQENRKYFHFKTSLNKVV